MAHPRVLWHIILSLVLCQMVAAQQWTPSAPMPAVHRVGTYGEFAVAGGYHTLAVFDTNGRVVNIAHDEEWTEVLDIFADTHAIYAKTRGAQVRCFMSRDTGRTWHVIDRALRSSFQSYRNSAGGVLFVFEPEQNGTPGITQYVGTDSVRTTPFPGTYGSGLSLTSTRDGTLYINTRDGVAFRRKHDTAWRVDPRFHEIDGLITLINDGIRWYAYTIDHIFTGTEPGQWAVTPYNDNTYDGIIYNEGLVQDNGWMPFVNSPRNALVREPGFLPSNWTSSLRMSVYGSSANVGIVIATDNRIVHAGFLPQEFQYANTTLQHGAGGYLANQPRQYGYTDDEGRSWRALRAFGSLAAPYSAATCGAILIVCSQDTVLLWNPATGDLPAAPLALPARAPHAIGDGNRALVYFGQDARDSIIEFTNNGASARWLATSHWPDTAIPHLVRGDTIIVTSAASLYASVDNGATWHAAGELSAGTMTVRNGILYLPASRVFSLRSFTSYRFSDFCRDSLNGPINGELAYADDKHLYVHDLDNEASYQFHVTFADDHRWYRLPFVGQSLTAHRLLFLDSTVIVIKFMYDDTTNVVGVRHAFDRELLASVLSEPVSTQTLVISLTGSTIIVRSGIQATFDAATVIISAIDMAGHEYVLPILHTTTPEAICDISHIPSGAYILRVEAGTYQGTCMVIIVR